MIYRPTGNTGLKTSVLTLGTGSLHNLSSDEAVGIFRRAYDAGITHFDTAESYGGHQTEAFLGEVISTLGFRREKYILSTKAFSYGWSDPKASAHEVRTLNRKYLFHAIERSLQKLKTEFVDIYYCHEPDPDTPIEEIAAAMDEIVKSGKARYWAVSRWDDPLINSACDFAGRFGRHKPCLNQLELNLLHRATVGRAMASMRAQGLGLAVHGSLAGGLLSGKYLGGIPNGSRAADPAMVNARIDARLIDRKRNALVAKLAEVAAELGCTVGQLAIAWALVQPLVATVLIAASNPAQLAENLGAVDVADKLNSEVLNRIGGVVGDYDQSNIPEELPLA